jgi:hypothetical protein
VSSVRAEVKGIPELHRKLERLDASTDDMSRAHGAIAPRLLRAIARRTRMRTGRLVAGWRAGISAVAAHVTNVEPYAGPQEYGWPARGIEEAGAVNAAMAELEAPIIEAYSEELRRQIKAIGGQP